MIVLHMLKAITYGLRKRQSLTHLSLVSLNKKVVAVLTLLFVTISLYAQNLSLEYAIIKQNKKVGTLSFSRISNKDGVTFKVESNVLTNMVVPVKVETQEMAHYKNGILQYSSIYRKVNDKQKVNKQLRLKKNSYILTQGSKETSLDIYPIRNSMVGIFCQEPLHISTIYSDNYQQLISIQKTNEHQYKTLLPNGNYNYYYFKNGICYKVEVHHSLYSLQFVLNKKQ